MGPKYCGQLLKAPKVKAELFCGIPIHPTVDCISYAMKKFYKKEVQQNQGPYSQLSIFFATHEWAQKARVLYYTWLERLVIDKHSCL
jgi:hypothetical protein